MFFMVNITWPSVSSAVVGKKYVEGLDRKHPHVNKVGVYVTAGGAGIKGYALFEAEKGYEEEGYKGILQAMSPVLEIDGCTFTVEPVLPVEEAYSFAGIQR